MPEMTIVVNKPDDLDKPDTELWRYAYEHAWSLDAKLGRYLGVKEIMYGGQMRPCFVWSATGERITPG